MIRPVVSPDNESIKLAAALRQKKYRDDTGLFMVEGIRFVGEALASNWLIEYAIVVSDDLTDARIQSLTGRLTERGCPVLSVPATLYRKISDTETPQGILAIVRQRPNLLTDWVPTGRAALWVILDAIQDPGNVGTIIRSADAVGADGVILTPGCADLYAGKTTRATMGSLFHLPVVRAATADCLAFCERHGLSVFVAGAEAAEIYSETDLAASCAVVFGNEGLGVGEAFRRQAMRNIRIPILGQAESLNVASAAAVILFEAARQRGWTLS